MSEHVATAYREELALLDHNIARMGGLTEHNLGQAFDALANHDPHLAQMVILADSEIDRLQVDVEELVISMIAVRQPMAADLRQIMAALKIAGDLERIGDLAKNISKRTRVIAAEQYPNQLIYGLRNMVERALSQLKDVLDAYADRDAGLARSVWERDQELDKMYNSVFRELLTYMMEDPRNISFCTHLLFGAKNLERIGDHATNIAEVVHFVATGIEIKDDRPKSDTTSSTMIDSDGYDPQRV